jgi:Tol biopolymer transport system component
MKTFERFERSIPELMAELAPARVPDYFDDMLRETASHGQRPAWSYPERWLPVEITARPLSMRSFPWRPLVVLGLMALVIAAALVAYVGSRPALPPPFGAAGNGILLYRDPGGAILSVDPATGATASLAQSADRLGEPIPSRDGQRIAYIPRSETAEIVISAVDGTRRTTLDGRYRYIGAVDWSPDGSHIAFVSEPRGFPTITVLPTDGSTGHTLSLERTVWLLRYLPDGRLAVVAGDGPSDACPGDGCALFLVNANGTGLDRLIPAAEFHGINTLDTSPDGRIVYVEWAEGADGRLHVVDPRDRSDRLVAGDFPERFSINRALFSPDGTSILFDFFGVTGDHWAVVPSDGGQIVRIGPEWPGGTPEGSWSPDGRSVLANFPLDDGTSQLWILDATGGGADRRLEVEVPYLPAWQRASP